MTRGMHRWHRRLGLIAALPVLVIAVTGILLGHSETLGLDRHRVTEPLVMKWYGIGPEDAPTGSPTRFGWVTWSGGVARLGPKLLARDLAELRGAVETGDGFAVATADSLLLFTGDGELIERLGDASLPGTPNAVGRDSAGALVLETRRGSYALESASLSWLPTKAPPAWNRPRQLPQEELDRLLRALRGDGLPLSRVILDLHSGRIFGRLGPLAMDAAAIGLLILAGTGIANFFLSRR